MLTYACLPISHILFKSLNLTVLTATVFLKSKLKNK